LIILLIKEIYYDEEKKLKEKKLKHRSEKQNR